MVASGQKDLVLVRTKPRAVVVPGRLRVADRLHDGIRSLGIRHISVSFRL